MNELVTRDQPRGYSAAAGNLDSAKKPDVPRRTILTVTHEARCPEAITAMAHRLARLVCRMLKYGQHYLDKDATYCDQRNRQQQIEHLKKRNGRNSRTESRAYFSPTSTPLADWPQDNAPCVALARMWSRVGHREIRQDLRLS